MISLASLFMIQMHDVPVSIFSCSVQKLSLIWARTAQLAAKVLKAGPADNQTLYIVGLGFMYKDHNASVEISDDGLSLNGAPRGTW